MRKTTTSLAVLAALFFTGTRALDFGDFHDQPQSHGLGASADGSSSTSLSGTDSCLGGIQHRVASTGCSSGCKSDEWGCDNHVSLAAGRGLGNGHHKALGSGNEVEAFVIPAQVQISNTTTDLVSSYNQTSSGQRQKSQVDKYQVSGTFSADHYDCYNNYQNEGEAFAENGCVVNSWSDQSNHHDLDCEANGLSSTDLLDFGADGCGTSIKSNVEDPEDDVTKKINKQIYSSIADVLNEIISSAISTSLTNAVTID